MSTDIRGHESLHHHHHDTNVLRSLCVLAGQRATDCPSVPTVRCPSAPQWSGACLPPNGQVPVCPKRSGALLPPNGQVPVCPKGQVPFCPPTVRCLSARQRSGALLLARSVALLSKRSGALLPQRPGALLPPTVRCPFSSRLSWLLRNAVADFSRRYRLFAGHSIMKVASVVTVPRHMRHVCDGSHTSPPTPPVSSTTGRIANTARHPE